MCLKKALINVSWLDDKQLNLLGIFSGIFLNFRQKLNISWLLMLSLYQSPACTIVNFFLLSAASLYNRLPRSVHQTGFKIWVFSVKNWESSLVLWESTYLTCEIHSYEILRAELAPSPKRLAFGASFLSHVNSFASLFHFRRRKWLWCGWEHSRWGIFASQTSK